MDNVYQKLLSVDTSEYQEKKNKMTYLSWAHAWREVLKHAPNASYEIIKNEQGLPYFKDEAGCMVYTKVTVEDMTHEMWLPVMDFKNKAVESPDMMQINKTVMRCLTKNLAMFGLGLHIYAGEDLPEEEDVKKDKSRTKQEKKQPTAEQVIARAKEALAKEETVDGLEAVWNGKIVPYVQGLDEKSKDEAQTIYTNIRNELLGNVGS